jgi:hypothetical protein
MLEGYDGYVSNKAAVVLATFHADCVPLYFYDPRRKAIGMAHAGWRGTVKGMAGMMVDRMAKEFGSRPQDLLVEIGPCISAAGYEVDLPVMEACRAITGETGLTQVNRDHGHVDLAAVNHRILLMKGVERCNISIDPRKTDEKLEEFYSHRKEGDAAGRTVAWITLEGETGEKTFVRRRAKKEHKISEKTS